KLTKNQSNIFCQWSHIPATPHLHADFYEFGFVAEGSYVNRCEEDTRMPKDTLFLFNMGVSHSMIPASEIHSHFILCIDQPTFLLLNQQFFGGRFDFGDKPFLACRMTHAEAEFMRQLAGEIMDNPRRVHCCRSFAYNSLYLLRNHYADFSGYTHVVADIIEKMNNYTYLACTMQDIYDQYPYSPATLIKQFKEKTGKTIVQYQLMIRLNCAIHLMTETDYSFEQITGIIGLSSTSYFFHAFKKKFGMTPAEYRAQNRKSEQDIIQIPFLSMANSTPAVLGKVKE
ncbi:MAG: AraC family transcriptional regulator, partial [Clostridia bacterium]|nr:AraC family transcriptional regulator [Clostridia bacterium]